MATPNLPSPRAPPSHALGDHRPHARRRSPSPESDRKRQRTDPTTALPRTLSVDEGVSWDPDAYNVRRPGLPHPAVAAAPRPTPPSYAPSPYAATPPYAGAAYGGRGPPRYENGFGGGGYVRPAIPIQQTGVQNSKSRRLYIGNIPYQAGLTDVAITQFFSALYVAGFRPNRPGEALPVLSFWLHADGKFGFMELRGEQETVNMMQFHGVFLHGRPLKVSRPSDYKEEIHNPMGMNTVPEAVNVNAVVALCDQLGAVVAPPAQLAAIAVAQANQPRAPPLMPTEAMPSATPPQYDAGMGHEAAPPPMLRSQAPEESGQEGASAELDALTPNDPVAATLGTSVPAVTGDVPSTQSAVISLRNLVTTEDLTGNDEAYQEILEDVEAEGSQYGKVLSLDIPRKGDWMGTAFVQFASHAEAQKAVTALSKRVFDGRQIAAVIVDKCESAAEAAGRPKST